MKQNLLTILFTFLLVGYVTAQPYEITYNFYVEKCNEEGKIEVSAGSMVEGGSFTVEVYKLPNAEAITQFFYNLLVGSKLGLPTNSLDENIHIDFTLTGICGIDPLALKNATPKDLMNLLNLQIDVTGEKSGPNSSGMYYLKNNKEFFVKILMAKIGPFLNFMKYSTDDIYPFFLKPNNELDYNGIRKETDSETISIYAQYLGTVGIGIGQDITDVKKGGIISTEYSLAQNYPNPFNPSTKISYNLPSAGLTKLTIYNTIGKEVQTILSETQQAGFHNVDFDASNLASGMYFYTLTSGSFTQTNKMILMK